jgi:hypothetical protein
MNAKWRDAVLVEIQYNEMKSKKGDEWKVFDVNMKSFDGDDLSHRSFINIDEEKGTIRLDRVLTQIITAKMKPEVLNSLKEAIGGQHYEAKDEILKSLGEASEKFGSDASKDYRAFAKKMTEVLEGLQFKVYWRGQGISSVNQQIKAGVVNAQIVIYPVKQREHIKNKTVEDFLNNFREGSIDERNAEAVAALDGLDSEDDSNFMSEKPEEKEEKPKKEKKPAGKKDSDGKFEDW